jgi:hypothetical protein
MSDTVIRRAARALNPDRPIMTLAELPRERSSTSKRGRRSTAKSWANGHRRPPIAALKVLLDLLKHRRATLYQLIPELEYVIMQREREPKHASGFMVRDPLTGQDKRNRRGRPHGIK